MKRAVDAASHEDEIAELDRLIKKARPIANEAKDLALVCEAIKAERAHRGEDDLQAAQLTFAKWQAIHKYIYARPFRLPEGLNRGEQWQHMARHYASLGDDELDEWLALQAEIADNRQKGIADLRIRRDGPCFLIVLEYVGNRKRTALAILHWAQAQMGDETD